ncbi:MAG: Phosphosulfolactate synthase, partial [uncultured Solirubrobacteraceae bacterium]
ERPHPASRPERQAAYRGPDPRPRRRPRPRRGRGPAGRRRPACRSRPPRVGLGARDGRPGGEARDLRAPRRARDARRHPDRARLGARADPRAVRLARGARRRPDRGLLGDDRDPAGREGAARRAAHAALHGLRRGRREELQLDHGAVRLGRGDPPDARRRRRARRLRGPRGRHGRAAPRHHGDAHRPRGGDRPRLRPRPARLRGAARRAADVLHPALRLRRQPRQRATRLGHLAREPAPRTAVGHGRDLSSARAWL